MLQTIKSYYVVYVRSLQHINSHMQSQYRCIGFQKPPSSYQSQGECCRHEKDVALLQDKLAEVYHKLMLQIQQCGKQQLQLNRLRLSQNSDKQSRKNYSNCAFPIEKQAGSRQQQSFSSDQIKTDLLQADLQAMRSRVLTQISAKNKLQQQMIDLKKQHKKQIQMLRKKFEGMEVLYQRQKSQGKDRPQRDASPIGSGSISRKVLQQKDVSLSQQSQNQKNIIINKRLVMSLEQANQKIHSLQMDLQAQKNKNKRINEQFLASAKIQNNRVSQAYSVAEKENYSSKGQLLQLASLKRQMGQLNRAIQNRQKQQRDTPLKSGNKRHLQVHGRTNICQQSYDRVDSGIKRSRAY